MRGDESRGAAVHEREEIRTSTVCACRIATADANAPQIETQASVGPCVHDAVDQFRRPGQSAAASTAAAVVSPEVDACRVSSSMRAALTTRSPSTRARFARRSASGGP